MSAFNPGDKVRLTALPPASGSIESTVDRNGQFVGWAAWNNNQADVEIIERADDPSKDPVGTVRTNGHSTAVKTGNYHAGSERYEDRLVNGWVLIGNGGHTFAHRMDSQVVGWKVIGSVPGTTAAEAQKPKWDPFA